MPKPAMPLLNLPGKKEGLRILDTFSKKGFRVEENPLLRDLLRDDFRKFILFKTFDIAVLSILVYWINMRNENFAYLLVLLCILLYGYIDYKNFQVQSLF